MPPLLTSHQQDVWRTLECLVSLKIPVILIGSAGSGKTFLTQKLAEHYSKSLVSVSLSALDANDVAGTFAASNTPGIFSYRLSSFAMALKEGHWVVLEELDNASTDTIASANSLLASETSSESFVMATARTVPKYKLDQRFFLLNLKDLDIPNDLIQIIQILAPNLSKLAKQLVTTSVNLFQFIVNSTSNLNKSNISFNFVIRGIIIWIKRLISSEITIPSDSILTESTINQIINQIDLCLIPILFYSISPNSVLTTDLRREALSCATSSLSFHCNEHLSLIMTPPTLSISNSSPPVLSIGRVSFNTCTEALVYSKASKWVQIPSGLQCLEQITSCVLYNNPVLLIGEAGCGKTFLVQHLAKLSGKELVVMNLSSQTESSDLMGSLRPSKPLSAIKPIIDQFLILFKQTFSAKKNSNFLIELDRCLLSNFFESLIRGVELCLGAADKARRKLSGGNDSEAPPAKKCRTTTDDVTSELYSDWVKIHAQLFQIKSMLSSPNSSALLSFMFIESSIVEAVKKGHWVLLDEANLAPPDVLHKLISVLFSSQSETISLSDWGGSVSIKKNSGFRLFAAINPATDVGKKALPSIVGEQFVPITVPDLLSFSDLRPLVTNILRPYSDIYPVDSIIKCYRELRSKSLDGSLVDESNYKPLYTLRSLTRVFSFSKFALNNYKKTDSVGVLFHQALHDGFSLCFGGMLSSKSRVFFGNLLDSFLGKPKNPQKDREVLILNDHVSIGGFKLPKGPNECKIPKDYIITDTVWSNLINVARSIAIGEHVLLQGETSVGKTSLIYYLAELTGNSVLRINNHLHTDLSEYLGTYVSGNNSGEFYFRDGLLVSALRTGSWIILDELNLAPSDVLEALNRLLDDNRELYIPETNEIIRPKISFRLFATQNPPGLYGGRKTLSRAFRSRFIELSFPLLTDNELQIILSSRVSVPLPPSHATCLTSTMKDLHRRRTKSAVFEGKSGLVTLRDLFRWAARGSITRDHLALHGYNLIAEKCRDNDDKEFIRQCLEKHCRVAFNLIKYENELLKNTINQDLIESAGKYGIVLTKTMTRMISLILLSYLNKESVLLVGGTGTGKTTAADFVANYLSQNLIHVSIHQHTDVSDLLGSIKPVSCLDSGKSFKYQDGPLITALIEGHHLLLDEISLADDAVLERLNSVFEADRSITVSMSEGNENDCENLIKAHENFRIIATMNPGGDYGKKELSPALRNRFTEIWIPDISNTEDMEMVLTGKLSKYFENGEILSRIIVDLFSFALTILPSVIKISLRDLLAWSDFLIANRFNLELINGLFHGACLSFIDSIGVRGSLAASFSKKFMDSLFSRLLETISTLLPNHFDPNFMTKYLNSLYSPLVSLGDASLTLGEFSIPFGPVPSENPRFVLTVPTSFSNAVRVARALSLNKPILIEGPPGAGKTSLVTALGTLTGNPTIRINFSEHSDMMDLIGCFVPSSSTSGSDFIWSDGVLLTALKQGYWVIFDEINLAPQQVLEGLNSVLDHRRSLLVTDLNLEIKAHENFRVFACQNPLISGGGRRGLPQSFLNRFVTVSTDDLTSSDISLIISNSFPELAELAPSIPLLIKEAKNLVENLNVLLPPDWPNLRDCFRFFDLIEFMKGKIDANISQLACASGLVCFGSSLDDATTEKLIKILEQIFNTSFPSPSLLFSFLGVSLHDLSLPLSSTLLPCQVRSLFSLLAASLMNWPVLLEGTVGTGKAHLIKLAHHLWSQIVNSNSTSCHVSPSSFSSLSLHPGTDVSDLLGGFVQVSLDHSLINFSKSLIKYLEAVNSFTFDSFIQDSIHLLKELTNNTSHDFISVFRNILTYLNNLSLPLFPGVETIENLVQEFEILAGNTIVAGQFKWQHGDLAKAVINGSYLCIQNASLCPPAMLDKLNALFERGGGLAFADLYPTRCTNSPSIVSPHSCFRAVLSADPSIGSVSPALLNRVLVVKMSNLGGKSIPTSVNSYVLDSSILTSFYSNNSVPCTFSNVLHQVLIHFDNNLLHFELFIKALNYYYSQANSWLKAVDLTLLALNPNFSPNILLLLRQSAVNSDETFNSNFKISSVSPKSLIVSYSLLQLLSPSRNSFINSLFNSEYSEVLVNSDFNSTFNINTFTPFLLFFSKYLPLISNSSTLPVPSDLISSLSSCYSLFKSTPSSSSSLILPSSIKEVSLLSLSSRLRFLIDNLIEFFYDCRDYELSFDLLSLLSLCQDPQIINNPVLLVYSLYKIGSFLTGNHDIPTSITQSLSTVILAVFEVNGIQKFNNLTNFSTILHSFLLPMLSGNPVLNHFSSLIPGFNSNLRSATSQLVNSLKSLVELPDFSNDSVVTITSSLALILLQKEVSIELNDEVIRDEINCLDNISEAELIVLNSLVSELLVVGITGISEKLNVNFEILMSKFLKSLKFLQSTQAKFACTLLITGLIYCSRANVINFQILNWIISKSIGFKISLFQTNYSQISKVITNNIKSAQSCTFSQIMNFSSILQSFSFVTVNYSTPTNHFYDLLSSFLLNSISSSFNFSLTLEDFSQSFSSVIEFIDPTINYSGINLNSISSLEKSLISVLLVYHLICLPSLSHEIFNYSKIYSNSVTRKSILLSICLKDLVSTLEYGNLYALIPDYERQSFLNILENINSENLDENLISDTSIFSQHFSILKSLSNFASNNLNISKLLSSIKSSSFLTGLSNSISFFLNSLSISNSKLSSGALVCLHLLQGLIQQQISSISDCKLSIFYPINFDHLSLNFDPSLSPAILSINMKLALSRTVLLQEIFKFKDSLDLIISLWETNEQLRIANKDKPKFLKTSTYDDVDNDEEKLNNLVNSVFGFNYYNNENEESFAPSLLIDSDFLSILSFLAELVCSKCSCQKSNLIDLSSFSVLLICLTCHGLSSSQLNSSDFYLSNLLNLVQKVENSVAFNHSTSLSLINFLKSQLTRKDYNDSDLYENPSQSNLEKFVENLAPIKSHLSQLLSEFPDNEILKSIQDVLIKAENISFNTPIIKLLKESEKVLDICLEWDVISPKHLKFNNSVLNLAQLSSKWRLLEFQHFKQVLIKRLRQKQLSSLKLFFHLLKLANNSEISDEIFIEQLHHFTDSSYLYDFELRLRLLILLSRFIDSINHFSTLPGIIQSFIQSRFIYLDRIRQIINQNTSPILSKLNEVLQVHSMNLTDPIRIKQQLSRTLRQLSRFIHSFDSVVGISFSQILSQIQTATSSFLVQSKSQPKSLSERFVVEQSEMSSFLVEQSNILDDLIGDVINQSNYLSNLSSSEQGTNLVSIKSRALSDLLAFCKTLPLTTTEFNLISTYKLPPNNSKLFSNTIFYFWNFFKRVRNLKSITPHVDVQKQFTLFIQFSSGILTTCSFISQLLGIADVLTRVFDCENLDENIQFVKYSSTFLPNYLQCLNYILSFFNQFDTLTCSDDVLLPQEMIALKDELTPILGQEISTIKLIKSRYYLTVNQLSELYSRSIQISTSFRSFVNQIPDISIFAPFFNYSDQIFTCFESLSNPSFDSSTLILPSLPVVKSINFDSIKSILSILTDFSNFLFDHESFTLSSSLLSIFSSRLTSLSSSFSLYFRTLSKSGYIISGIFLELSTKGFCRPQEEKDQQESKQDESEGVGMGEGSTTSDAKDVSDEIENKEQLSGLEGQDNSEPQSRDQSNSGFDMEDDFQGENQNVASEEENEQEKGEEEQKNETDEFGEVEEEEDRVEGKGENDGESREEEKEETGGTADGEENELAAKDDDVEGQNEEERDQNQSKSDGEEFPSEIEDMESGNEQEEVEIEQNNQFDCNHESISDPDDMSDGENDLQEEPEPMDGQLEEENVEDEEQEKGEDHVNTDIDDVDDQNHDVDPDCMEHQPDKSDQNAEVANQLVNKGQDGTDQQSNESDQTDGVDEKDMESTDQSNESSKVKEGKGNADNGDQSNKNIERHLVENAVELMRNLEIIDSTTNQNNQTESIENDCSNVDSNDLFEFSESNSNLAGTAAADEEQKGDNVRKEDDEDDEQEKSQGESKDEEKVVRENETETENSKEKDQKTAQFDEKEDVIIERQSKEEINDQSEMVDERPLVSSISNQLSNVEISVDQSLISDPIQSSTIDLNPLSLNQWRELSLSTSTDSFALSEKFRQILEPTLASKLKGDFKTGKRLNLKKIVPFIASNFKKDSIWLRRTLPSKRNYSIAFAIDNSQSMKLFNTADVALRTLVMMLNSLSLAEVGQFGVLKFGSEVNVSLPLSSSISDILGGKMLSTFTFDDQQTDVLRVVTSSINFLSSSLDSSRLLFIISDGRFSNQSEVEMAVRLANQNNVLIVFLIVDNPNAQDAIVNLKTISYPNGKLKVDLYLDQFPFPFYIILRDPSALTDAISSSLQQWLAAITS
ncbi:hypothetical protein RCL1_001989 [Eukaryota sp. TZLM3-RCL]